ncbi:uncharacterized protein LOC116975836 [Amblyraja radiata]|uniref:uncharacterized protein LOC116975836 n=1 Tax=Amblyraja radiata TaxID=386614 RepID=UPI00140342D5|nr:uncharacterized protein LOC116975836 [Amblyraja radiata]
MSEAQLQDPFGTGHISESFGLVLQTQLNWETFLTPLSTSVAILADLSRQAKSGNDFPLQQDHQTSHSDDPTSFQGWLLRICLQAPKSFQAIRDNMFKIQANCEDMPVVLRMVSEDWRQDKGLPQKMGLIQACAAQCKVAAGDVERIVTCLNLQLSQLLERAAASQKCSQEQLQEVQRALDTSRESSKSIEEDKAALEEDWAKVSQEREKIRDALNDIKSRAFTETLAEEVLSELKERLPQVLDLARNVSNPAALASELVRAAKFVINEITALKNKDPSSALVTFLVEVEEKAAEKIRQVQSQVDQAGEKYDQHLRDMESLTKRSAQLSEDLSGQETQEKDIGSTMLLMSQALELLGSLQSNWSQTLSFIHLIPGLMAGCQRMLARLGDGKDADGSQVMEYQDQMSQVSTMLTHLGATAGVYIKVYDRHLKGPLKDLAEVLAHGGRDYKLKTIQRSCQRAREEIHRLAKEQQRELGQRVQQSSQALGQLSQQLRPRG